MGVAEIVRQRIANQDKLRFIEKTFEQEKKELVNIINALLEKEALESNGIDSARVENAKKILYVEGNPSGRTEDSTGLTKNTILDLSIEDLANGACSLKNQYFGNKRYDRFYQRCDCEYGMGPRHGSIVDRIGLTSEARRRDLTEQELDDCIYYLNTVWRK